MIKTPDLIAYLPPILQDVRELQAVTNAENPEFQLVFDTSEQVLKNLFIYDCDLDGIKRYEAILGIKPSVDDTLESRIFRVFSRWNDRIPYTWKAFLEKLDTLCGEGNYTITLDNGIYTIYLVTHIGIYGGLEEIYNLLNEVIPCNLVVNVSNILYGGSETAEYNGGTIASGLHYMLTSDLAASYSLLSRASGGSALVDGTSITIHNL